MLGLAVAVEVAGVGGLRRDADREERQQRRDEVRARVGGVGHEAEAPGGEPDRELQADEDGGRDDGRERGAALRGHAAERYSPGGAATRRLRATRIPTAIEGAAEQLDGGERLPEQRDGDRGREERLQVGGERRARRADPVEHAEPELVRDDERPDRGRDEDEPHRPAEVEVLRRELRDRGQQDEDRGEPDHDGADLRRRVAAHQRGHEDRVRRPADRGEHPEEHAAEIAGELGAGADGDEPDAREGEQRARPEAAAAASRSR